MKCAGWAAAAFMVGCTCAWPATGGLVFEPSVGQAAQDVRFLSRGGSLAVSLSATEATLVLPGGPPKDVFRDPRATQSATPAASSLVRMRLVGADARATLVGEDKRAGRSHYLKGKDPARWRTNVPHFAKVRAKGAYAGVDVLYSGESGELRYDFVLAPGSDPAAIRMAFEGVEASVDDGRNLVLKTPRGDLVQAPPVLYQRIGGRRRGVSGGYVIRGQEVGFTVGRYDKRHPLVIDPVVRVQSRFPLRPGPALMARPYWLTYLGGGDSEDLTGIAVDSSGSSYVSGTTCPTGPPPPSLVVDCEAYVAKFSADGKTLVYFTTVGGDASDGARGIAIDAFGQAHLTGTTQSDNFPTAPANVLRPQKSGPGLNDAFVVKLNAEGNGFVYSTYLGGDGDENGTAIAVGLTGGAFVAGEAHIGFPVTPGVLQAQRGGHQDAFVARLNASGTALVYSTYLGGSEWDDAWAIAVDADLNAYVAGYTRSPDFPLANAIRPTLADGTNDVWGQGDAFVAKLNPSASALVYATYLGGSGYDEAWAIALDGSGSAYVAGLTNSQDFLPLINAFQPSRHSSSDTFLTKLDPAGAASYSTYLGGSDDEMAWAVAVDGGGVASVVGYTETTDWPGAGSPFQAQSADGHDAFMSRFNPAGVLVESTYLGGRITSPAAFTGDAIKAVATAAGEWYFAGVTGSTDLPANGYDTTANGGGDGFVFKLGQPGRLVVRQGVEFSAGGYTVSENGGRATITAVRSDLILPAATVRYGAYAGTATAGTDFMATSGTLSFQAGERRKTFDVAVMADPIGQTEGTETVGLVLASPTGGLILGRRSTAVLSITDSATSVPQ